MKKCRYLGVHLENRLDWRHNIEAVFKKGQRKLCFSRKLRSCNVWSKLLDTFYMKMFMLLSVGAAATKSVS